MCVKRRVFRTKNTLKSALWKSGFRGLHLIPEALRGHGREITLYSLTYFRNIHIPGLPPVLVEVSPESEGPVLRGEMVEGCHAVPAEGSAVHLVVGSAGLLEGDET